MLRWFSKLVPPEDTTIGILYFREMLTIFTTSSVDIGETTTVGKVTVHNKGFYKPFGSSSEDMYVLVLSLPNG